MPGLETLVWVCPLGLGGQGACLVVLGTPGWEELAARCQAFSLMASRLWLLGVDFLVLEVAVGYGNTRFLVGN